jgi:hypothetical protein
MQRIAVGDPLFVLTGSKYLAEEPECLWDSGAVACQCPRLMLWWVGRPVFRAVYSLNQVKLSCNTESGGGLMDQRNKGFAHNGA